MGYVPSNEIACKDKFSPEKTSYPHLDGSYPQYVSVMLGSTTGICFEISLHVFHKSNKFGLHGAWAAGERAGLPEADRELLEEYNSFFHWQLNWIHQLSEPKDAETVLYA